VLTRFVCLANSLKEGGRCIAGIELDDQHQPVFFRGRPKWIRPVWTTEHGEIPLHMAIAFDTLDILEMNVTGSKADGYQSENVSFVPPLRKVGAFDIKGLEVLCDDRIDLFGNHGKAISTDNIGALDHSLVLLGVHHLQVENRINVNRRNKPQVRACFEHHGTMYDLPLTDPIFRGKIFENPNELALIERVHLCVSIGIAWEGWHYKLVAGVFY
jgi:hypothetical protein